MAKQSIIQRFFIGSAGLVIKKAKLSVWRFFIVIIIFGLNSGFFPNVSNNLASAQESSVIINEIAWMGTANSANDEWMELKNLTNQEINLDGWSLTASDGSPKIQLSGIIAQNSFFLLERTDDESVPGISADQIYTGALGNSGEILELKNSAGEVVDSVDASTGWAAGDNSTKQTMERNRDFGWGSSKEAGGTPKAENSNFQGTDPEDPSIPVCGNGELEESEECDDGNLENGDGCDSACAIEKQKGGEEKATSTPPQETLPIPNPPQEGTSHTEKNISKAVYNKLGDVLINEFVSDPSDGEVEWIELYNITNKEINLDGWKIIEGSEKQTVLSGKIGTEGKSRFFVVEKPKGSLNNSGDKILLYDLEGNLIDKVLYGDWKENYSTDNAPAVSDPNSVARKYDGHNTFNNTNDFTITISPTKGQANAINFFVQETNIVSASLEQYDFCNQIIISEILPDPSGDDEDEFIELFNGCGKDIDLFGWRVSDDSGKFYEFKKKAILKNSDFALVKRSESQIALNNNGDVVKLFQPLKIDPLTQIKYEKAVEGLSFNNMQIATNSIEVNINNEQINKNPSNSPARMTLSGWPLQWGNTQWEWSEAITPGKMNIIKIPNRAPMVDFSFPQEIQIGTPINFDSSDTVDTNNDSLFYLWDFGDGFTNILKNPTHTYHIPDDYIVKLSVGDGKTTTTLEQIIKIIGYNNASAGSSSLPVQSEIFIKTNGNINVIISEILPDPAGNEIDGEWIELFNKGSEPASLKGYFLDDSEEGSKAFEFKEETIIQPHSYLVIARKKSKIALNNEGDEARLLNPRKEVVSKVSYEDSEEGYAYALVGDEWLWTSEPTAGRENIYPEEGKSDEKISDAKNVSKKDNSKIIETTLEEVKNFAKGDLIKVKGTVAVEPGILGAQYFYIVGSPGLQIYNFKKDFPDLKIGDYIEVAGELSVVNGEKRLKTKSASEINILEKKEEPAAIQIKAEDLSEDLFGSLVELHGEILERKGSALYLDDGTEEAEIYMKANTGINYKELAAGTFISVKGIAVPAKNGMKIIPRNSEDIKIAKTEDSGAVLGEEEKATTTDLEMLEKDKKKEMFQYLLILAIGVIIIFVIIFIKLIHKRDGDGENLDGY